jgi:hypothetical protein
LFDDYFGEILIVFIVDVDDLDGHCEYLLEGIVETNRIVRILSWNCQHLEGLIDLAVPLDGDHHLIGGEAVMQHFEYIRVVFE